MLTTKEILTREEVMEILKIGRSTSFNCPVCKSL